LAGLTFEGARDVFEALGYKKELSNEDYRARYERNSVAARVVEAFPKSTWRGDGLELIENPDPNTETPFETAWNSFAKKLNVQTIFKRADILAGLGRYSTVLIVAPGKLSSPLPTSLKPEEVLSLACFAEDEAKIKEFQKDPLKPRLGLPLSYNLKRLDPDNMIEKEVHWSRIVHVADGCLDDHVYGQPRLQRVWNLLDDLEKVTGAGSEAFWLRAHQGYHFDLDKEVELDDTAETQLSDEVDEFVNNIRRAVRTRGVKLTSLGSDVANFDRNVDSIITQISSGTGIPKRILVGSEQGQLASEQDRVNWAERVQDRRNEFAGPTVVRQFVDRLIEHGALPEPSDYDVRWPQIFDLSDDERAKIAVKYAEINQKAGKIVVTVDEIRDLTLGLGALPEEARKENEETAKAAGTRNKPGIMPGGDTSFQEGRETA
jgi:hypothetical protein